MEDEYGNYNVDALTSDTVKTRKTRKDYQEDELKTVVQSAIGRLEHNLGLYLTKSDINNIISIVEEESFFLLTKNLSILAASLDHLFQNNLLDEDSEEELRKEMYERETIRVYANRAIPAFHLKKKDEQDKYILKLTASMIEYERYILKEIRSRK